MINIRYKLACPKGEDRYGGNYNCAKYNQFKARNLIKQAIEQENTGNVKDFDEVFDRLEKNLRMHKYHLKITEYVE